MGAEGFHGRVRDGIGCLAPRYGHQAGQAPRCCDVCGEESVVGGCRGRACPCAGGWALHAGGGWAPGWPARWDKPIERLVPVSCTGCPASTSGLSTWWSTTALGETWF